MKLIYPAYVIRNDEKEGYIVTIPDIDCMTEADTLSEAITHSVEAASEILMKELESGNPIPKPTPAEYMKPVQDGFITMLMMDMSAYTAKAGTDLVKKSLNIPRWLNSYAEARKIDYSELMRNVLTSLYEEQYSPETAIMGKPILQINQRR